MTYAQISQSLTVQVNEFAVEVRNQTLRIGSQTARLRSLERDIAALSQAARLVESAHAADLSNLFKRVEVLERENASLRNALLEIRRGQTERKGVQHAAA
jgi:cell division protein FtsL